MLGRKVRCRFTPARGGHAGLPPNVESAHGSPPRTERTQVGPGIVSNIRRFTPARGEDTLACCQGQASVAVYVPVSGTVSCRRLGPFEGRLTQRSNRYAAVLPSA
jgi:hypothetical protein